MVAAGGALYLINPLHGDFIATNALGDLLIIGNCICYGSYIAFSKNTIKRYGTFTAIFWIFIFGFLGTVPFGVVSLAHFSWSALSAHAWLSLLYIVVGPTVTAYFLNAWALERVTPSIVAAYIYLQPLIAFITAPLILGEKPDSRVWLAALLIFSGVGLVTQSDRLFHQAQTKEHVVAD
jgi:drug/metabolite transporter (DMT)-like permease